MSIEDVRDHLDEIPNEGGYTVPGGPADEMSELFATIMAAPNVELFGQNAGNSPHKSTLDPGVSS